MTSHFHVTAVLLVMVTSAFGGIAIPHAVDVKSNLRDEIERVSHRRIFFGHQSVGVNLLDGIRQSAKSVGIPINVVEVKSAGDVGTAMIGHSFISENGKPLQKMKNFELAMHRQPHKVDIAFMKFCYVDFDAHSDVKAIFSRYREMITGLRARYPNTIFVHVTAPLTTVQSGLKSRLKQLIGRAPEGTFENQKRDDYNILLREAFRGREPIFDLAQIESTLPNGEKVSVAWEGRSVPVLVPSYTDDGGHLNALGRQRAARELITVLAAIPDNPLVK